MKLIKWIQRKLLTKFFVLSRFLSASLLHHISGRVSYSPNSSPAPCIQNISFSVFWQAVKKFSVSIIVQSAHFSSLFFAFKKQFFPLALSVCKRKHFSTKILEWPRRVAPQPRRALHFWYSVLWQLWYETYANASCYSFKPTVDIL